MSGYFDEAYPPPASQSEKNPPLITIKQSNGVAHWSKEERRGCENGHLIIARTDKIKVQVYDGDGPIRIASRIAKETGIELHWLYDIVLQNPQYFASNTNFRENGNLKEGDILTISWVTIIAQKDPSCVAQTQNYLSDDTPPPVDTTQSLVHSFDDYKIGVKGDFSGYAKLSFMIGVDAANIEAGIDLKASGVIDSDPDTPLYDASNISYFGKGQTEADILGWRYKLEAGVRYYIVGNKEGEFEFFTSSNISRDAKFTQGGDLRESRHTVVLRDINYNFQTNETTLIIAYKFSGAVSESARLYPALWVNFEVGGAVEGAAYVVIKGNPLGLKKQQNSFPLDKNKM